MWPVDRASSARTEEPAADQTTGTDMNIGDGDGDGDGESDGRTAPAPKDRDDQMTGTHQVIPVATTAAADRDTPGVHLTPATVPISARNPVLTAPASGSWWARVPTNPAYAPELLALAAVETLGPRAREWVQDLRERYPAATPDGLARLAVRRFSRAAAVGGVVASATGVLAPVASLASLAWTQSGLVLHLAAAYGVDPTDVDRAVDLLVLARVHPSVETAKVALAEAVAQADDRPHTLQRATEAAWRLAAPLGAQTAGWLVVLVASRLVRGGRLLVAGAADAAATERLAHRAIAHYRHR
ncbi:MAG TPA: hypothetical protein VES42_00475 [Pilimelia sp.]|nr:hypothetical protein [Pilimelia sp.]